MPEADSPRQQLRRRLQERGMPEEIVKARLDAPVSEGVEEHRFGLAGFVRMELVEEVVPRMGGVHKAGGLLAQDFDLRPGQNAKPGNVPMLVKECDLLWCELRAGPLAQRPQWLVDFGKVSGHWGQDSRTGGGNRRHGTGDALRYYLVHAPRPAARLRRLRVRRRNAVPHRARPLSHSPGDRLRLGRRYLG